METHKMIYSKDGIRILEDHYGNSFFNLEHNSSVVVLVKEGNSFILIKQFRNAVNDYVVQLPGGGVEPNEDLELAARRELREETGITCGKLAYLGSYYPANWISNDRTHIYYTEEILEKTEQTLEIHEKIELLKIETNKLMDDIRVGKIGDSELSHALLLAILNGYLKTGENPHTKG